MGAGYVGILSVELHFPEAGSLKGKRKFVKSAKAQLQNFRRLLIPTFGYPVSFVQHHLFAIMRPAFCIRRSAKQLPHF